MLNGLDSPASLLFMTLSTKPIGGMDGEGVVTDDPNAAAYFKTVIDSCSRSAEESIL